MGCTGFFASILLPTPSPLFLPLIYSLRALRSSPPIRFQPSSSFSSFYFSRAFVLLSFFLSLISSPLSRSPFSILSSFFRDSIYSGGMNTSDTSKGFKQTIRLLHAFLLVFRCNKWSSRLVPYFHPLFFFFRRSYKRVFYFLSVVKTFPSQRCKIFPGSMNDPQAVSACNSKRGYSLFF